MRISSRIDKITLKKYLFASEAIFLKLEEYLKTTNKLYI